MRLISRWGATTVAATAALLATGLAPAATADTTVLAPHDTFTMPVNESNGTVTTPASGEDLPNVDSVKSTIRAYYSVHTDGPDKGLVNQDTSNYITEVAAVQAQLLSSLPDPAPANAAVVFDTDDTLLWNYDYEDKGSNFNFDPASNAAWVTGTDPNCKKFNGFCFPEVPGASATVRAIAARGYAIYVITGRPVTQKQATLDNLAAAGFTSDGTPTGTRLFTSANTYTKWGTNPTANLPDSYDATQVPDYIKSGECSTHVGTDASSYKCTTVEYKAQTRKHIQDTDGVDIMANVGDQLSDLWGGYADQGYKIPNPTYFLSSPDLDAAHRGADDQAASLVLPDTYTMKPDGSSGSAPGAKGDQIPNIDPVRTNIRSYYAASAAVGIANKTTSPYISDLKGLESTWTQQITTDCQSGLAAIDAAKAKIAAAHAAVTAADKAIAAAQADIAKAQKALHKARKHHNRKQARKALRALNAAVAAQQRAVAAKAAASRVLATTKVPGKPAAVFDADDTTLWTYDMEDGAMKFVFNPAVQNDEWVQPEKFPAVPGMPQLVAKVADAGCTIIGITGRSNDQKFATIGNLLKNGYTDFSRANYYTKWYDSTDSNDTRIATRPAYLSGCSTPGCTTIEYKSGTRKMLEEQRGFDIVANLGDQFSDLIGGYADHSYKLPNPTYYLP